METVANLASSASRAIWGDQTKNNETGGQEPIAGETGDVKAGEPYDKGNLAVEDVTDTPTDFNNPSSNIEPSNTSSTLPGNTASTGLVSSENETDKTGITSLHNPTSATDAGLTPSVGADPLPDAEDTLKNQDAEEAAKIDVTGPGPQTLESKTTESSELLGGSDESGPQKESLGEGTGEKYIKSTGVQADGGNFDAANAGAAREADRLLEQKNIQPTTDVTPQKEEAVETKETNGKEGKVSLKEKIKAKLHKH